MSLSQNEDPATNQWCVTLACKVLIGYLLICIVIGALLSDPVLQLLGLNEQLRILIDPIKKWLFILVTAPLLYWIVAKLTQSFQRKNELLEKIKSQVVRLNRMHRIISESSHIILRSHDRRQLLRYFLP